MDLEAQLLIEDRMRGAGERRASIAIQKAMDRGDAAETPAGIRLAKQAIDPVSKALSEFIQAAFSGGAGRRHTAARMLADVDPDLAAFVAVRAVLSLAAKSAPLVSVAMALANRLELEILADKFEAANGGLYRAIIRNAETRGMAPARQAKAVELANNHFKVVDREWTQNDRLQVGVKLIELILEHLDIAEAYMETKGKRTVKRIRLRPDIEEWFHKYNHASTLLRPLFLPTVVPPKPWEDIRGGAYYSPVTRGGSIITKPFPGQLDAIQATKPQAVFDGLNALQETPWRINKRVLAVMQEAWDRGLDIPCLPRREDIPLPEAPAEVVNDVKGGEHRKAWRRKMRLIHEANAASRSVRFEFARALATAGDYAEFEAIYFPHRLDFRGRAYAASTSLNPQGPDEVRGLLEFSKGKPLGERGLFWLGVHGANLFGNDKVSLEERYQWAIDNWMKVIRVVQDPLADLWWTEADKPWCFLAWCFEWRYAASSYEHSKTWVSHLPIALDGSCNGIQHFSALLRDPVGGAAVNLVPAAKPSDIYAEVAKVAQRRLEELAQEEGPDQWVYQGWAAWEIDRKITKRPVMVLPYGGTAHSCREYTRDAVKERISGGAPNPFGDELNRACGLLASVIWASIGDVVVAARAAMEWLQKVARVATQHGVPLRWTTPTGLPVFQHYRETKSKQVRTRFCGSVTVFRLSEPTDVIDRHRQASSIAPNFIHSLDASAMFLTILACKAKGIHSFAMIHDSYGTHAADTDALAHTLREEFVKMHQRPLLEEFRDGIAALLPPGAELPPLPAMGSLDLNEIMRSAYFFA